MNPFISLFDETCNSDYSDTYILNLYRCHDFLAYCIVDSVRKKFIALRAFSTSDKHFAEQIAEDQYLKFKYKKVKLLCHSVPAVLVPASVFSEEDLEKFYTFSSGDIPSGSRIASCRVNEDIECCFSISSETDNLMKSHEDFSLLHPYAVIINKIIANFRSAPGVYAELYKEGMILAAAGSEGLRYCNYFSCNSPTDFAYHTTAIYQYLDWSCSEVTLYYSGITERNDARLAEISRFVSIIKPVGVDTDYLFSYRFNETQRHWLTLLYDIFYADNKR
jgi:hypothetical protein